MNISFETLRNELIGKEYKFDTPYGERKLTYADFTASGKALNFIEKYLLNIQKCYANTHTEDDMTGEVMTNILHKSEKIIKKQLNAEENCFIIPAGNGATGAIECFSKIIGVYIPPATKIRINNIIKDYKNINKHLDEIITESEDSFGNIPVIFIGPYEHHSNILIWKEGIAEVVEINLTKDGTIDLNDLKFKVSQDKYKNRLKMGSISAASNVTGVITPVYDVAKILHENNALACFDFAACAPYVEINMNKSEKEYFDAVYLAPHKFLGGPQSTGILVFNKKLYDNSNPPTVSGGGTVKYVSPYGYDYIGNVEEREMVGTPGIIQIFRAALVFELKNLIGINNIEKKEKYYAKKVFDRLNKNQNIEILGPSKENERLPIFSIMIKYQDKFLHPRFIAKLLNDLFGIQTRAGCACAAPYGHKLLDISKESSCIYRHFIQEDLSAIRPGYLRFNIHYIMDENEVDFILDAVEFVANYGYLFLSDYIIDLKSGKWRHKTYNKPYSIIDNFGVEDSLNYINNNDVIKEEQFSITDEYKKYLFEAKKHAQNLNICNLELKTLSDEKFKGRGWFYFVHSENEN